MPLIKVEKINSTSCWALWQISESLEELKEMSSPQDIQAFNEEDISHPIKQSEWLAARLVLKSLTALMKGEYVGSRKDAFGKPYLIESPMYVSITNSFPFAAGIICSEAPVGIDLERPRNKLLMLAPKFLNPLELQAAEENVHKLCLYWCAKETLFKIHGKHKISFSKNLYIPPFTLSKSGTIQGIITTENDQLKYDICYSFLESFVISYNIN